MRTKRVLFYFVIISRIITFYKIIEDMRIKRLFSYFVHILTYFVHILQDNRRHEDEVIFLLFCNYVKNCILQLNMEEIVTND